MDPTAALAELIESIALGDFEQAQEYLAALKEWKDRGGFPPNFRQACRLAVNRISRIKR